MPEPTSLTPQLLRDWPLPELREGKESRGTVLVVGGSRFTPGAVLLAGTAALRAGAGRLQLATTDTTASTASTVTAVPAITTSTVGSSIPSRAADVPEPAISASKGRVPRRCRATR